MSDYRVVPFGFSWAIVDGRSVIAVRPDRASAEYAAAVLQRIADADIDDAGLTTGCNASAEPDAESAEVPR